MRVSFLLPLILTFAVDTLAATCDASNAVDVTPYLQQLSSGGGDGGAALDPDYLYRIIDNAVKRRVVKRATLDCTGTETCVALQGFPLCYDAAAWTWRDAAGDNGNLQDGSYTLSDGRKGNLYTGPYPLPNGGTASAPAPTGSDGPSTDTMSSSPAPTPSGSNSSDNSNPSSPSTSAGLSTPTVTDSEPSGTSAPSSTETPNGGVKTGANLGLVVAAVAGALAVL
ncbi:hypothetical protein AA313_de0209659 [Arthrobotrys entomopaga]|nr:hypothetical protein AA313_de0209659 [Arthrobotrys entomopaga]